MPFNCLIRSAEEGALSESRITCDAILNQQLRRVLIGKRNLNRWDIVRVYLPDRKCCYVVLRTIRRVKRREARFLGRFREAAHPSLVRYQNHFSEQLRHHVILRPRGISVITLATPAIRLRWRGEQDVRSTAWRHRHAYTTKFQQWPAEQQSGYAAATSGQRRTDWWHRHSIRTEWEYVPAEPEQYCKRYFSVERIALWTTIPDDPCQSSGIAFILVVSQF